MELNNKIFSELFTSLKLAKKRPSIICLYLLKWHSMGSLWNPNVSM